MQICSWFSHLTHIILLPKIKTPHAQIFPLSFLLQTVFCSLVKGREGSVFTSLPKPLFQYFQRIQRILKILLDKFMHHPHKWYWYYLDNLFLKSYELSKCDWTPVSFAWEIYHCFGTPFWPYSRGIIIRVHCNSDLPLCCPSHMCFFTQSMVWNQVRHKKIYKYDTIFLWDSSHHSIIQCRPILFSKKAYLLVMTHDPFYTVARRSSRLFE